jgi:cobalamin biosynthesis protein CbiM
MHIMEGFLPPLWCAFWYLLCVPFWIWGTLRLKKLFRESPELKLTVAISGAFMFVLSSLKLPSVAGSSSHPTGTGLSVVLSGPGITTILATIVLVFQAMLLAHGGVTTLGANVFSMGVAGPFVAFAFFKVLQKANANLNATVFITAFVADIVTYVVTAFQLALAYPGENGILGSMMAFMAIFALTQIPLAIVEGILVVLFFDYLSRRRPELIHESLRAAEAEQ